MARLGMIFTLVVTFLLLLPGVALAALAVTRAELNGDQLRVEGQGAAPNAIIQVDGVDMGVSGADGSFRFERSGFSSPTCRITVSDFNTTVEVTLSGCTPSDSSPPPPAPEPPPQPPGPTTASFQGLGHLPGGAGSFATGISGDGSDVVGFGDRTESPLRAFRWTPESGMQDIGTLGGGATARAVSFDGTWIVGQSHGASGQRGFRWSSGTGMQELPMADAVDVSDDGSVVVGFGLRWRNGAVTRLGGEGGCNCSANGVSGDGDVAVGWFSTGHPDSRQDTHAFRWTDAGGLIDLGLLDGREAIAEDANRTGSVIIGQARDKDGFWRAFRWTPQGGMVDLGTLRNGAMSAAFAVSADGSVAVGQSLTTSSTGSERAFRWTSGTRMEDVKEALIDRGVTKVNGWVLLRALDVSADGKVIAGVGRNPDGFFEAWVAVLP